MRCQEYQKQETPGRNMNMSLRQKILIRSRYILTFFGERADQYPLSIGDDIKLSFDIESREYNGRWFTSIRGWKAEKADGAAVSQAPVQQAQPVSAAPVQQPAAPQQPDFGSSATDDLPF